MAFGAEPFCRMYAAAGLRAAPASKRAGLVLRWLRAEPADIADYDPSGDDTNTVLGPDTDKRQLQRLAAVVLSENLEWIERHAEVRAWLSEHAQGWDPVTRRAVWSPVWEEFYPAHERLLSFHASRHPEASLEAGRAILRAWLEVTRATLVKDDIDVASYHPPLCLKLFALADFAGRFGLREEAQTLFDDIARRVAPPPSPEDSLARLTRHLSHANDAKVASLLLAFTAAP